MNSAMVSPAASAVASGIPSGLSHSSDGVIAPTGGSVDLVEGRGATGPGDQLDREQDDLRPGRDLDPDVADPGQDRDERDSQGDDAEVDRLLADLHGPDWGLEDVDVEQAERVDRGDLGEARHHDDVGHDDRPAGYPAEVRTHGLGDPGEARPAVGLRSIHVVVGDRDEQHRNERQEHDRGGVDADGCRDEAERHGEAVGGRRRGNPDDDVRNEPQGAGLEALLTRCARPADGDARCHVPHLPS
jgi:hypothetical protein